MKHAEGVAPGVLKVRSKIVYQIKCTSSIYDVSKYKCK